MFQSRHGIFWHLLDYKSVSRSAASRRASSAANTEQKFSKATRRCWHTHLRSYLWSRPWRHTQSRVTRKCTHTHWYMNYSKHQKQWRQASAFRIMWEYSTGLHARKESNDCLNIDANLNILCTVVFLESHCESVLLNLNFSSSLANDFTLFISCLECSGVPAAVTALFIPSPLGELDKTEWWIQTGAINHGKVSD